MPVQRQQRRDQNTPQFDAAAGRLTAKVTSGSCTGDLADPDLIDASPDGRNAGQPRTTEGME